MVCLFVCCRLILLDTLLGLHDISHAIFNVHLVRKAGSVIRRKFPSCACFHTEQHLLHRAVFTDKLRKTTRDYERSHQSMLKLLII